MTKLNRPLTHHEYVLGDDLNPTKYKFAHHPSIEQIGIMKVTCIVPPHLSYEVHSLSLCIVDDAGKWRRFEFQENLPCEMSTDNARKVWERLVELGWVELEW